MADTHVGTLFDAGAAEFAAWSQRLWDRMGELTTGVSAPRPGERVLDACCGAGASAIPAAMAVAPDGSVDAVDLSQALLEQGRERSAGLPGLRFIAADACTWPEPGAYDLVQVVHGVAFFSDMDAGTSALVRALRPGGRMAVTVWADGALGSFLTLLRDAVAAELGHPVDQAGFQQARERIADAGTLTAWLERLGLEGVEVVRHDRRLPLDPDTAWEFVLGNAARAMLSGLDPAARDRVRDTLGRLMAERGVTDLDVSVHIALGRRPRS
ncbi:class I SAM-dependent methyltransferase [Nocardiopsis sediminis]|uniref:Class I SAM-dependent methyltransferase n=1 Tax=Nocardiopsis sediminis TaxID=1778267 RepID=A0ABV8FPG7_9ACTN